MEITFLDLCRTRESPLIIAEIGANYGGIDVVKNMVRVAAGCGADIVKFQTYRAETIATPGSFFTFEDGSRVSQFDFFRAHEFSKEDHDTLDDLCKELGIPWISTPSHWSDLELLEKYELPFYKTGSDDITNLSLLKAIAAKGRPMLVSTGMCTMDEIKAAVEAVQSTGNRQLVLLHCVVSYPSKAEDANLRIINTLQETFGLPVGLSDHTQDDLTSILATQMGAVVIEKHFTLDHALNLPDHEASLDPVQFRRLVDRVGLVRKAMGDGVKRILQTEEKWREAARKSIYTVNAIAAGETIQETDLTLRRPASGIHPQYLGKIIGGIAAIEIPQDTLLTWDMLRNGS
jgi:N,N'-diacetyllegionaminate synthase